MDVLGAHTCSLLDTGRSLLRNTWSKNEGALILKEIRVLLSKGGEKDAQGAKNLTNILLLSVI